MSLAQAAGTLGVGLILAAFTAQQAGRLRPDGAAYLLFNALGAGLACLSSVLIGFWPFVVLEGVWALVAIAGLARIAWRACLRRGGGPRLQPFKP